MKRKAVFFVAGLFCLLVTAQDLMAQGRLIRRIQQEAENKAIEELFGKEKEEPAKPGSDKPETSQQREMGRNQRGGGLDSEIPDVNQHIADARNAFSSKDFSGSRASIRQALWGVELEIGREVLASLPESVSGLKKQDEGDRVSSTGIGFVGLMIERHWVGGDDQELSLSIGSDAGLLGLAGAFAAGGMYMQTTEDTGQKQIRYQEHQAYISYDDYEGYSLGVPFGQSSLFVLQGVNFESESAFMAVAGQFNLSEIKKKLGEQ